MKHTFKFNCHAITKDNSHSVTRTGVRFLAKKYKDFEKLLVRQFEAQKCADFKRFDEGDLCVSLNYTFKNRVHSDAGNLPKSTLDAFNKIIWKDDRQIHHLSVDVNYGQEEGIILEVEAL